MDDEKISLSIRIPKEMHDILTESKTPGQSLNVRAIELLTQALLSEGHKLSWIDEEDVKPLNVTLGDWASEDNMRKFAEVLKGVLDED